MKIMIVDDSAAMRMIVKKTLRQAGFEGHEITEAEDGVVAGGGQHHRERLAVVTANEIEADRLAEAPAGLRRLPWWGVQRVGTRQPKDSADMLRSVELGLSGVSLVMQPGWWLPWQDALPAMQARAKPLAELMARRPEAADALRRAARDSGLPPEQLRYLPLTSHKTLDWVALLDAQMNLVGWAPVDGF